MLHYQCSEAAAPTGTETSQERPPTHGTHPQPEKRPDTVLKAAPPPRIRGASPQRNARKIAPDRIRGIAARYRRQYFERQTNQGLRKYSSL